MTLPGLLAEARAGLDAGPGMLGTLYPSIPLYNVVRTTALKAAVYTRYGPPEVVQVQDVEKPRPNDHEVLVRVYATTVAAADWRMRKSDPFFVRLINGLWRPKKIRILGMEFAGTVESVGNAVTRFTASDRVFGSTGFKFGTHAGYVCIPADDGLSIKPANMTFEESAAVLFGGLTALYFLRKANIQAGENVLIYGASGSVVLSSRR